jgi:hypothetical protein
LLEDFPYDDLCNPWESEEELYACQDFYSRMGEKKMAQIAQPMKAPPPYVFVEFPHVMFHVTKAQKIVKDKKEEQEALKDGWEMFPVSANSLRILKARIPELEKELTDSITEFEQLTGTKYEDWLIERERESKK